MVADLPWEIHLSDAQVWQREQIILEVSLKAPDPFALLKADKLVVPGMEVVRLPETQYVKREGPQPLRIRWQLYPYNPGTHQIKLPAIRYYLFGGTKAKWQPPIQNIEVQALPPYLSPTTPVGMVDIESHIEPSGVLKPDSLVYWHVTLKSTAVTPAQFPPILKQLGVNKALDVLPAKVSINTNKETGIYQLGYQIPVKAKSSGRLDLPELQWHWFDPKSARLKKLSYQAPRPWVLARWEQVALVLGSGLLLLAAMYQIIKRGLYFYRRWRARSLVLRRLQNLLNNKGETQSVRQAMADCTKAHGWPNNLSTQQWLKNWEQRYGENQLLRKSLQVYEQECFSGNKPKNLGP